jgi:pyrroline-5-carboxylate reductase
MHIVFIGGGNMASALIGGLLAQPDRSPADVSVVDVSAQAREALRKRYGVSVFSSADETPPAEVLLLAVKPLHMREAAAMLEAAARRALVVSVAAGIRTADLSRWLDGHARIVRAMPNMPALVSAGITGLFAMQGVSGADRDVAERIMRSVGSTLWVEREELLDAVTALSGSGPAYAFYVAEAMEEAALGLGLDDRSARRLAVETLYGAMRLAMQTGEPPGELRARVTSKGGTTERALQILESARVRRAIVEAVRGATQRARELGEEYGKD